LAARAEECQLTPSFRLSKHRYPSILWGRVVTFASLKAFIASLLYC
jgi:hypothetical protein